MESPASADSARFVLPRRGWRKQHGHRFSSFLLLGIGIVTVIAGLLGVVRRVGEFQRLDFRAVEVPEGLLVVEVQPRSGAARAGLSIGNVVAAVDGGSIRKADDLDRILLSRRLSQLTVTQDGKTRQIAYYPPVPQVDVQYLLVAFAAMFTLGVAGLVFAGRPTALSGRFLALAEALFAAVVIPFPEQPDARWQLLILVRDFGRLALPPLLVVFFASFPSGRLSWRWLWLAFVPSSLVAFGRTALAGGWLGPISRDILVQEALDEATAALAVLGAIGAAALGVRAFVKSRHDPTRRRQVEWVALGAAAGFTPYLLLSLIPQLAGADLEVVSWISLLPLTLVPLGVASSLLEFRLWDLEDISRQVTATGVAVLLGGISFALLNYGITQVGFRLGNWRNLVAVAGGILLVALTVPARRVLLEQLERFQYRERLAARRALTAFAEEAAGHRDPEGLLARLTSLLQEALGLDRVVTYLERGGLLVPLPATGALPVLSPDEVRGPFPSSSEAPLRDIGLWHRFPLERDERIVGVVYCGRRGGELPLGHGERRLVAALAAQAALALENSMLLADLRRQVEEHRLLEDYLERIFQSSAAALLVCDARGEILRANHRAAALLKVPLQELKGRKLGEFVYLPPDWRGQLPDDADGAQVQFERVGEMRMGLMSCSALETEPGKFDGRVVALDDISDQLSLEQRLAQQERLAALGRLAAGLAHEVNTPVTGIASYAQLLRELTPGADPRSPLVTKLEEQAFRVARIVTNLLELARPAGFERQLVDLAAVAREESAQMRAESERIGVMVECHADDETEVAGNRVQLELVVHNLLRNAVQATPTGGRVTVRVGTSGGNVWMEVADTGPGVPSELGERIFEPFVTTRQGRGGTGLGLAITRDIVRAHGGDIRVLPNEPHGTVMRVEMVATGVTNEHPDR